MMGYRTNLMWYHVHPGFCEPPQFIFIGGLPQLLRRTITGTRRLNACSWLLHIMQNRAGNFWQRLAVDLEVGGMQIWGSPVVTHGRGNVSSRCSILTPTEIFFNQKTPWLYLNIQDPEETVWKESLVLASLSLGVPKFDWSRNMFVFRTLQTLQTVWAIAPRRFQTVSWSICGLGMFCTGSSVVSCVFRLHHSHVFESREATSFPNSCVVTVRCVTFCGWRFSGSLWILSCECFCVLAMMVVGPGRLHWGVECCALFCKGFVQTWFPQKGYRKVFRTSSMKGMFHQNLLQSVLWKSAIYIYWKSDPFIS